MLMVYLLRKDQRKENTKWIRNSDRDQDLTPQNQVANDKLKLLLSAITVTRQGTSKRTVQIEKGRLEKMRVVYLMLYSLMVMTQQMPWLWIDQQQPRSGSWTLAAAFICVQIRIGLKT